MVTITQFAGQFDMGRILVKNSGMVERVDDFFLHYSFQVAEIDDHPQFYVRGVGNRGSDYRHGKFVTVPVYVAALAIITIQGMAGLEIELFGNADFAHGNHLKGKGSDFGERILSFELSTIADAVKSIDSDYKKSQNR